MGQADPSQMVSDYSQSGESMPSYQSMEAKPLPDTINIDQVKRSLVERWDYLDTFFHAYSVIKSYRLCCSLSSQVWGLFSP